MEPNEERGKKAHSKNPKKVKLIKKKPEYVLFVCRGGERCFSFGQSLFWPIPL